MSYRILIVDDEPDILEILGYNLKKEGYEVFMAEDGLQAIVQAKKHKPHLIVMDVMMPNMDGIEACIKIRETPELSKTIITFLSARSEDYSQISGLNAGADDYLTKPFFFSELNARLKSVIRRLNLEDNRQLTINEITLFPEEMRTLIHGKIVELTGKEFGLLLYFFSNPNRVISKTTLGEFMSSSYADYGFTDDVVYTCLLYTSPSPRDRG